MIRNAPELGTNGVGLLLNQLIPPAPTPTGGIVRPRALAVLTFTPSLNLKVSHTRTVRVARQDTPGGVFSRFLTLRQLSGPALPGRTVTGCVILRNFSRDPCRRTARSPHKRKSGLHEEKYGAMAPSGISRESGSNQAGWK